MVWWVSGQCLFEWTDRAGQREKREMRFVCHVNLCFKTFFYKMEGEKMHQNGHIHVPLVMSKYQTKLWCLCQHESSVLDWKIISDACLISDKNLAEHQRCQRAHNIVFLGLFRFTATVLLTSAILSLTSHLPYVVSAPHRGLLSGFWY